MASKPVQVDPEKWYLVAHGGEPFFEECCDCGLCHRVTYKLKNGQIFANYQRDERATKAARKRRETE